jgi:quercetin dioxygenase-like cupin family protein
MGRNMIVVEEGAFSSEADAVNEIRADGYWFQVFVNPPPQAIEPHSHEWDARLYVLSGTAKLTDTVGQRTYALGPGAKVIVPKGEQHLETIDGPVTIIYATSSDPGSSYQMQR